MTDLPSVVWIGLLGVALSLPALLSGRFGPWVVRVAGLLVLGTIWFASLNRTDKQETVVAPELILVTTGAKDDAGVERMRRAMAAVPDSRLWVEAAEGGSPNTALAAAAMRATPARDIGLLWNGPFDAERSITLPGTLGRAPAWTTAPPPTLEPGSLELRSFGVPQVGRAAACELRVTMRGREDWPADAVVSLRITAGDDQPLFDAELDGAALRAEPQVIDWMPKQPGPHRCEVELRSGEARLVAAGNLEVTEPDSAVWLVGGAATRTVAAALQAQGMKIEVHETLPDELPAEAVVVVLDALPDEAQQRLLDHIEDGGGALLVGSPDGGALPMKGELLASASPLWRLAVPPGEETGDGAGDQPGSPDEEPPEAELEAEPPAPEAEPAGDESDAPQPEPEPSDDPVSGDTSSAGENPQITEAEVRRRQIALVLIIDRSGSMSTPVDYAGNVTRMDIAKRSAFDTARALEPTDQLGIVAFDTSAHEVIQLEALPSEQALGDKLAELNWNPRGGTLVMRGLERAGEWLRKSKAAVRHSVILTDGELTPRDTRRSQSLARRMAIDGITVSMIQLAQPGLAAETAKIASFGKGTFVRTADGTEIPRLVFAEVKRALGAVGRLPGGGGDGQGDQLADASEPQPEPEPDPFAEPPKPEPDPEPEPPEEPVPPSELSPRDASLRVLAIEESRLLEPQPEGGQFPSLAGVVEASARDGARVLLVVENGTPLLGFANRGLGRVGAWASDLAGGWSQDWRDDPFYPGRLAAWIESLRPVAEAEAGDDLLDERRVEPIGPIAAERATLAGLGFASLTPITEFMAPGARKIIVERGRAIDDALFGILALVFLAFVEWLARRAGS